MGALSLPKIYNGTLAPIDKVVALLEKEFDPARVSDFAKQVEAARRVDNQNAERAAYWGELGIWSTRRLGELIELGRKERRLVDPANGRPKKGAHRGHLTLDAMGIERHQAQRAQQLARIQPENIREYVDEQKAAGDEVSKAGLWRFVSDRKEAEKHEQREQERQKRANELRDFLRRGKAPVRPVVSVLLADPPWRYQVSPTDNRRIENHYPTATVEEICHHINAPWAPVVADDAVLFLWVTAPQNPEGLQVMEAWGFRYRTGAVWDKEKIGMGYWFRGRHELLLVGTRGRISPPAPSKRVSSIFQERRGHHSRKPECVYQAIETMFPDAVKGEMYQRAPREGWFGFGNEAG